MRTRNRGWLAALLAFALFAGLATLPRFLPVSGTPSWIGSAKSDSPIDLPGRPPDLPPLRLAAVAQPVQPDGAPATTPSWDPTHMAALVAAEDQRLRNLIHHANRISAAGVVTVAGALPTLVLPPRPQPYTLTDLETAGAVQGSQQRRGQMLLVDSVLVTRNATLDLGGSGLTTLLMNSTATGFTSLVTWGGTLEIAGTSSAPLTIEGWDQTNGQAAQNRGYGRPYIRAVGGKLDLAHVFVASLGFWSGRTGGVAWTGVNRQPATGSAVSTSFVGDTYGAFVSRANGVEFKDDLFELNELDGVRLHRNANNIDVIGCSAVRNGGNGFVVSRGATNDALQGDLAVHNAGNGFFVDGRALVSGASPSGGRAVASVGTLLAGSDSENNVKAAFIVEGGNGTIVHDNIAVSSTTGIAIRAGATNTVVVGNVVRSGGRVALSIGPAVTGTTVAGNTLLDARIGILIRNSPGVRLMNNRIGSMSVFAVSVRGGSDGVVGNDNVVGGKGFDPIDVRAGAPAPTLVNTDQSAWQRRSELNWVGYLRYHPMLATWLVILVIVALCLIVARVTQASSRPYRHTVAWQSPEEAERIFIGHPVRPALGFRQPALDPDAGAELTA